MTRKTLWILVPTIVVGLLAAPIVWAHQQMHAKDQSMFMMLGKMRELRQELNLTDDQVNQLRTIATQTRDANRAERAAFRANIGEAGLVLLKNPDDVAAAQKILDRNDEARLQLRASVLQGVSDAIRVLTPDQREKVAQKIQERAGQF